jgi:Flp pilus assembly protein CpaB
MTSSTPGFASHNEVDLFADVYHSLAQPLTELHGTLELALRHEADPHADRDAIKQSLVAAERAIATLRFLRDTVNAKREAEAAQGLESQ